MMTPPKVGSLSQMTRRSRKNNRSLLEPTLAVKNPAQMEGVVDVDAIPSPEQTSSTLVEEQMQVDPPSTIVGPNQMHETTIPTIEVDEERNESDESRAQPSIEKTQYEQI